MITEKIIKNLDLEWVDVKDPSDRDIERLSVDFGLPHLLILDCLKPEHLPKYEETREGHFLMLRCFDQGSDPSATTVQSLTRKIALFITDNRIVAIHKVSLSFLDKISANCSGDHFKKDLRGLVHEIIFETIRTYDFPINRLQDQYENFESEVLAKSSRLSTVQIYHFRRQIFVMKRLLNQTSDALSLFREFWSNDPSRLQDLRENIDHLHYNLDEVAHNFDHLFQLNLAISDQRANQIMKTLTVFASVLLPLTFLASFYGMNFPFLPGLHSPHFFYLFCASMLIMAFVTIYYFHRRGWFHFRTRND